MTPRKPFFALILLAALLLPASCGPEDDLGGAHIGVTTQALSQSDVAKVTITVTSAATPAHFSPAIVHDLVKNKSGNWVGVISKIPVGDSDFSARAYDSSGLELYAGTMSSVTVAKGKAVTVAIVLQQSVANPAFKNASPKITGVSASTTEVAPGGGVSLKAAATDPDGGSLKYGWSATCGSLPTSSFSTTTTTTWTAPSPAPATGQCVVTVTAKDSAGGQAQFSITIKVNDKHATGTAALDLSFNHSPSITGITADNGHLKAGEQTTLRASVTDPEGTIALTYAWTDSCSGAFPDGSTGAPVAWTAPATAPAGNTCTLSLSVSDGAALASTGSLTITIGNTTTANLAPTVLSAYQSELTVATGAKITFEITAKDPEGKAVTITWKSLTGAFGTPTDTTTGNVFGSRVEWTTPVIGKDHTVTAEMKDAGGVKSEKVFSVELTGYYSVDSSQSGKYSYPRLLWVDPSNMLWLVTGSNDVRQYDGAGWSKWTTPLSGTSIKLNGIWGSSSSDIWLVGDQGTILHWNGTAWNKVVSNTTMSIGGIWGISANDIWAVNGNGLQFYNGTTWSSTSNSYSYQYYYDVCGTSSSDIWYVGYSSSSSTGRALHYKDSNTSYYRPSSLYHINLRGVWSSISSSVWAVGDKGTILHFDGTNMAPVKSPTTNRLYDIWGHGQSDIWAVGAPSTTYGSPGTLLHYNGTVWTKEYVGSIPANSKLVAVHGNSSKHTWLAGYPKVLLKIEKP